MLPSPIALVGVQLITHELKLAMVQVRTQHISPKIAFGNGLSARQLARVTVESLSAHELA